MSDGTTCMILGLLACACSSDATSGDVPRGDGGSATSTVGGRSSGGRAGSSGSGAGTPSSSGTGQGGGASGSANSALGGATDVPSSAGASDGGDGGDGDAPLRLSCATPPLSGGIVRPQAYRVSLELDGSALARVTITEGDAQRRPTSQLESVLEATLPVTVDETRLELAGEGYKLRAMRGDLPAGLYAGRLELGLGGAAEETETLISCWRDDFSLSFRYDLELGKCTNASGENGKNVVPLEVVRETKQGECVAFASGDLNGQDLGYPDLVGWQLLGADLGKAGIHFANLLDADLRGAKLAGFSFGYAKVVGRADTHTLAPPGSCKVEAEQLSCAQ